MQTAPRPDAQRQEASQEAHEELRHLSKQVEARFPADVNVDKLLGYAEKLGVHFLPSEVREQWLYHPAERIITVWLPDLAAGNVDFVIVMLAHELGHAVDFDLHPEYLDFIRDRHWSEVPPDIERSAFITGFRILYGLGIPADPRVYAAYIEGLPAADLLAELDRVRDEKAV